MKTQKFMYVVVVAIATLFFTSCERYETQTSLKENDIVQNVDWKPMVTDSVKKEMIHYFMIIGKDNCPVVSDMLIHKQFGILNVPDSLIKEIPDYYYCFYSNQISILEKESYSSLEHTLWKVPQTTFNLKVLDPVSFNEGTVIIVARTIRIFWQVVIIILFMFCSFLAFIFLFEDDHGGLGIFFLIVAISLFILSWFYLAYFVFILFAIVLIVIVVWSVVYKIRLTRKKRKEYIIKIL